MWRCLLLFLLTALARADSVAAVQAARQWRLAHEAEILGEFTALLAIPNIAGNVPDMLRSAAFIEAMYGRRGVRIERLQGSAGPPALYGELTVPDARGSVVFYVHYDGQPVEASRWTVTTPFQPIVRDGRIWARSASDDKAPLMTFAAALDALKAGSVSLRRTVKFFFDGEEEAGSPHIAEIIGRHKDRFRADAWIFCDGPVHQNRQQQVVFGARGSTAIEITVFGARRELHSGHYGNWAPNPAMMLAHLLASMRDEQTGKVLVQDFYKDVVPLSAAEEQALAGAPDFDAALKRELGLAGTEGDGRRLDQLINLPALNVQGLSSAGVGPQMRNVIPDAATAGIGIRLVKGTDWRAMQDRVIAHIRSRGYHVVESDPDDSARLRYPRIAKVTRREGYNAIRAPMDSPIAGRVVAAVEAARGNVIRLPTLGGSLPIAPIAEILDVPVIIVPIANHDNNQHGHNENIRLENLWHGIETMAALLAME
jgi:acetylornithine deacetylase/succinyl-diaminopimelate desuccinylase-like protein